MWRKTEMKQQQQFIQIKDVKKQKLAWCDSIGDLLCRIVSLYHIHYTIPLL